MPGRLVGSGSRVRGGQTAGQRREGRSSELCLQVSGSSPSGSALGAHARLLRRQFPRHARWDAKAGRRRRSVRGGAGRRGGRGRRETQAQTGSASPLPRAPGRRVWEGLGKRESLAAETPEALLRRPRSGSRTLEGVYRRPGGGVTRRLQFS